MRLDMTLIVMALLTACRPAVVTPNAAVTLEPTAAPLAGSVEMMTPLEGSIIYSELITLSGVAAGLPDDSFRLMLTGPDGEQIAGATVRGASGAWSIELAHSYTGDPIEVAISAQPLDPFIAGEYTQRTIALAGLSFRPEGIFGSITLPADPSTVGGEFLLLTGTASGVPGHALTIDLLADDGSVITRTYASTANPYRIDDMPFTAELATNNHIGPATIQLGAFDEAENTVTPLDSIRVNIDTAAG
jgi:hypothetical protein